MRQGIAGGGWAEEAESELAKAHQDGGRVGGLRIRGPTRRHSAWISLYISYEVCFCS